MKAKFINLSKKYRIYFLLLSTVAVIPCSHASDATRSSVFIRCSASADPLSALYPALTPVSNSPEVLTSFSPSARSAFSICSPKEPASSPSNLTEFSPTSAFTPFQKNTLKTPPFSDLSPSSPNKRKKPLIKILSQSHIEEKTQNDTISKTNLSQTDKNIEGILNLYLPTPTSETNLSASSPHNSQKRKRKTLQDNSIFQKPSSKKAKKENACSKEEQNHTPSRKTIKRVDTVRANHLFDTIKDFVQSYTDLSSDSNEESIPEAQILHPLSDLELIYNRNEETIQEQLLDKVFTIINENFEATQDSDCDKRQFFKKLFTKLFTDIDPDSLNDSESFLSICDQVYGFSSRTIALFMDICNYLKLGCLKSQSHSGINAKLKHINREAVSTSQSQKIGKTPFSQLSEALGVIYQEGYEEIKKLQKSLLRVKKLQDTLTRFIQNAILSQDPITSDMLAQNTANDQILNEAFTTLLTSFELTEYLDSCKKNISFNKRQFFAAFLKQLFALGEVDKFNNLINQIHNNRVIITKNALSIYICTHIYEFSLNTMTLLGQITELSNSDYLPTHITMTGIKNVLNKLNSHSSTERMIEDFFFSSYAGGAAKRNIKGPHLLSRFNSNFSELSARLPQLNS